MKKYYCIEWWNYWFGSWNTLEIFKSKREALKYFKTHKGNQPNITIRLNYYMVTLMDYHKGNPPDMTHD